MKNLKYILSIYIGLLLFNSCKKDTSPIVNNTNSSSQLSSYNILISTKWKQTHEYYDTTSFGKANLNLWPLSSTIDIMMDSCELTSKVWYNSNHNLYTLKGLTCPLSDPDTNLVASWNLILNDTKIVFDGTDTMNVFEINNNHIKLWYKSEIIDSTGSILYTAYNMWKFEPTL